MRDFAVRRRPKSGPQWGVELACLVIALLAVSAGLLVPSAHESVARPDPLPSSTLPDDRSIGVDSAICSNSTAAYVTITPASVSLEGTTSQTFTAQAWSACGTRIDAGVSYTWNLSRSDLGSLGSSLGPQTVYTSCVAPMTGTLSVTAVASLGRATASAALSIWYPSTNGSAAPFAGAVPGGASNQVWVGLGIAGAFVGGGIGVVLAGLRRVPPGGKPRTEESPSDSAAPRGASRTPEEIRSR